MEFIEDESVEIGILYSEGRDDGKIGIAMSSRVITNILWITPAQWEEIKKGFDQVVSNMGSEFVDPSYKNSSFADFRFHGGHSGSEEDLT